MIVSLLEQNSEDLNQGSIQSKQRTRRKRYRMKKMTRSMGKLCVGHVERTMRLMSSGFVVTYVRSGSMASV